ncbi:hypothetical protein BDZ45DRAFT_351692 [Acephala macrosclerotiorum]|nr:hypothetical protein BDZ45DRAFT_351692 [Acephala macrosclerotiorum]
MSHMDFTIASSDDVLLVKIFSIYIVYAQLFRKLCDLSFIVSPRKNDVLAKDISAKDVQQIRRSCCAGVWALCLAAILTTLTAIGAATQSAADFSHSYLDVSESSVDVSHGAVTH